MSTTFVPQSATFRREPGDVREVGGVFVSVQQVDRATAEVLADVDAVEKITRRRGRGPIDVVWDDELDPDTVEWAPDED